MMMELSDADFERLVRFMQGKYGINLAQKRQLINSRLSTSLRAKGYESFSEFVDDLLQKQDHAMVEFILSKLTTNYTYFMREKEHYDYLMNTVLPEIVAKKEREKVLSIWSAGCSSGEEPYNLSMCIKEFFGPRADAWDTRVLATDISPKALAAAKNPAYEQPKDVPAAWLSRYFIRRSDGMYTVTPDIRKNVIFRTFNLMEPINFRLKFDVIFCRNVMIYFDQPTKDALVRRFYNATAEGGYLFIGQSENIGQGAQYQTVGTAIYKKV